jgi:hypothetical protein
MIVPAGSNRFSCFLIQVCKHTGLPLVRYLRALRTFSVQRLSFRPHLQAKTLGWTLRFHRYLYTSPQRVVLLRIGSEPHILLVSHTKTNWLVPLSKHALSTFSFSILRQSSSMSITVIGLKLRDTIRDALHEIIV